MESEKGVTLITVTIYIIVMLIIVAVIAVLTSYFYTNIDINSASDDFNQQYTSFNSYFTEEINKKGNKILDIGETENSSGNGVQRYVVFSSGNQYTYIPENEGIYVNQVKIAYNITDCTFTRGEQNGKTTITVTMKKDDLERTTTYSLVE